MNVRTVGDFGHKLNEEGKPTEVARSQMRGLRRDRIKEEMKQSKLGPTDFAYRESAKVTEAAVAAGNVSGSLNVEQVQEIFFRHFYCTAGTYKRKTKSVFLHSLMSHYERESFPVMKNK